MTTSTAAAPATWRSLFSPEHRDAVVVMAGGILLFAMNVYLTAALLPSAIAEIGGRPLYGWTMTAFLVPAVVASLLVGPTLRRHGARAAFVAGFGIFGAGSLVAALAPTMPVLLAGRAVQGLAGGLLAGLGYGVIRSTLPPRLHSRALGVVSAMWGVGNLLGPTVGGLFAQLGWWRWALVFLIAMSVALGALAVRSMPAGAHGGARERLPGTALVLMSGAAVAVSVAGVLGGPVGLLLMVSAGALLVGFVLRERTSPVRVLPAITYRAGNPLKWVYLGLAVLAVASTSEAFIPLFGQELGRMGPLAAGLLGAALSWGWSGAAIPASGIDDGRRRALVRVAGPGLLALGIAGYALLQQQDPGPLVVVGWFVTLVVAGAGIGMAFQHGATAAMASSVDDDEATQAATGVTTVQLMSNALGSAVAGALVNLGLPSTLSAAQILLWSFAALAVAGVVVALRANARLRAVGSSS